LTTELKKDEYEALFRYLKSKFPGESSNIKINIDHKNWKKALELLKKLKIEDLELK